MKVYLAGKITGDPDYKFKFFKAATRVQRAGHVVLNPASLPEGMTPDDYMAICMAMINRADAAAFLPDWRESRGATLEHEYSLYCRKRILYLKEG